MRAARTNNKMNEALLVLCVLIVALVLWVGLDDGEEVDDAERRVGAAAPAGTVCTQPPVGNCVVALLELTPTADGVQQTLDIAVKADLDYIGTLNGFTIPIVDTKSDLPTNLTLLQQYYNQGVRIFLGFDRSTILQGVLPWFTAHPDTFGISVLSSAISLSVAKNVIRLTPPDSLPAFIVSQFINQGAYTAVLYVVESTDLASMDIYTSIVSQVNPSINSVTVLFQDLSNDQTDIANVLAALAALPSGGIVYIDTLNYRNEYLTIATQYYEANKKKANSTIDTSDTPPLFDAAQQQLFQGLYFYETILDQLSLSNREIREVLGPTSFVPYAYDAYNIARSGCQSAVVTSLPSITSHTLSNTAPLDLDANNDRIYATFAIEVFMNGALQPYQQFNFSAETGLVGSSVFAQTPITPL
jgi:hypothetical protein